MKKTELRPELFCSLGGTDKTSICVLRVPSLGLERPGREFYYSVLSSVQLKNESKHMPTCAYEYSSLVQGEL